MSSSSSTSSAGSLLSCASARSSSSAAAAPAKTGKHSGRYPTTSATTAAAAAKVIVPAEQAASEWPAVSSPFKLTTATTTQASAASTSTAQKVDNQAEQAAVKPPVAASGTVPTAPVLLAPAPTTTPTAQAPKDPFMRVAINTINPLLSSITPEVKAAIVADEKKFLPFLLATIAGRTNSPDASDPSGLLKKVIAEQYETLNQRGEELEEEREKSRKLEEQLKATAAINASIHTAIAKLLVSESNCSAGVSEEEVLETINQIHKMSGAVVQELNPNEKTLKAKEKTGKPPILDAVHQLQNQIVQLADDVDTDIQLNTKGSSSQANHDKKAINFLQRLLALTQSASELKGRILSKINTLQENIKKNNRPIHDEETLKTLALTTRFNYATPEQMDENIKKLNLDNERRIELLTQIMSRIRICQDNLHATKEVIARGNMPDPSERFKDLIGQVQAGLEMVEINYDLIGIPEVREKIIVLALTNFWRSVTERREMLRNERKACGELPLDPSTMHKDYQTRLNKLKEDVGIWKNLKPFVEEMIRAKSAELEGKRISSDTPENYLQQVGAYLERTPESLKLAEDRYKESLNQLERSLGDLKSKNEQVEEKLSLCGFELNRRFTAVKKGGVFSWEKTFSWLPGVLTSCENDPEVVAVLASINAKAATADTKELLSSSSAAAES